MAAAFFAYGKHDRLLTWHLALGGIGAAILSVNLVITRTRQGLGDAGVFSRAVALQSLTFLVLGIIAAAVTESPALVVCAWLLSLVGSTFYALRGYERDTTSASTRVVSSRTIIATSLSAHVGFTGIQLLYRADIPILGLVVPSDQLGLYSVAAPVAELTWVISEALSLATFSGINPEQDVSEHNAQHKRFVAGNLIFSTIVSLVIALGSIFLLPRLLPAFSGAVPIVLILLPGTLIQGASRVSFSALVAMGARREAMTIGVVSAVLSTLYVPFALWLGVTGAAIASTIIYVLQASFVFFVVRMRNRRLASTCNAYEKETS
jgi:O-antigen/teichoic acid export membrane protein